MPKKKVLSMEQKLLPIKERMEELGKEFAECTKLIGAMGFKVHLNADNSVFLYKDTRESYGEFKQPETPNAPNK